MGRSIVFSDRETRAESSTSRPARHFRSTGGDIGSTGGHVTLEGGARRIAPEGVGAGAVGGDAPSGLLFNENFDEDEDGDDSSTDTPFGSPRSTTPASSDDDGEIGI